MHTAPTEEQSPLQDYIITDYWPVRFKIMRRTGKVLMTLNRVMFEYDLDMNELEFKNVLVLPSNITNVNSPLDYYY